MESDRLTPLLRTLRLVEALRKTLVWLAAFSGIPTLCIELAAARRPLLVRAWLVVRLGALLALGYASLRHWLLRRALLRMLHLR